MNRALIALLLLYKRYISPLLPPSCRYSPTCSEYMRLAVIKYGFWYGALLGMKRVFSCHPFHPGGIDLP